MMCVIGIYNKCAQPVPLKDKNVLQSLMHSKNLWINLFTNQTRYGYIRAAVWWHDNGNEMHWTQNEGKSVVAERFIRTLKTKIYKHITTV